MDCQLINGNLPTFSNGLPSIDSGYGFTPVDNEIETDNNGTKSPSYNDVENNYHQDYHCHRNLPSALSSGDGKRFIKTDYLPNRTRWPTDSSHENNWRPYKMHEIVSLPLEEFRMAVVQGNLPVVKTLLTKGIGVDQILKSGWTALMFACSCGKSQLVEFLLRQGADPNIHKEMFTSLMAACASSQESEDDLLQCVNLLLDFGAKADACERHRMTSLMFACKEGRLHITQRLIKEKVDINKQDNKGWSALCWAATRGHGRVVRTLLEHSADPSITNIHGQTPADIALAAGYTEIGDILERAASQGINGINFSKVPVFNEARLYSKSSNHIKPAPFTQCGEMEMVLSGLNLSDLIPLFQLHQVTLQCFLRLSEDDLVNMGIEAVGTRKKLLQAIADIHKQEWKTSSLPNLSALPYITLPDAVAMVANINRHIQFVHASIGYLRDQIQASPRILQLGQEKHSVSTLSNSFSDSLKNISHLGEEVKFFKAHLDQVCDNAEYTSADLIVLKSDDGRWWQRRLLASLVTATSIATILYFCKPSTFASLFSVTSPQQSVFINGLN